jgi:ribosomal protein L12E/L44/L45/RPP1/RPP2
MAIASCRRCSGSKCRGGGTQTGGVVIQEKTQQTMVEVVLGGVHAATIKDAVCSYSVPERARTSGGDNNEEEEEEEEDKEEQERKRRTTTSLTITP